MISSACSNLCAEKGFDLFLLNRGTSFRTPPAKAKILIGDIRDKRNVEELIKNENFDAVVNWIGYSEEHVKTDYELFSGKTKQYIFISSASAYQKPPAKLPITEDVPLFNPYWEYSQKKIEAEKFLTTVFRERGFPVTICRPSHTYDRTKLALYGNYTVLNRMRKNKKIVIHGDGESKWTLTNAKDFARGFIGLLGNQDTVGEAYHITSDEVLTWNQISKIISEKMGCGLNAAYLPPEHIVKYDAEWGKSILGDKMFDTVFDNSKIRKIVPDFKAEIPYARGVEEIIEWYSKKENQAVDEKLDALMDKAIAEYKNN